MFRPSAALLSGRARSALITGGGSGIGLAVAHAFARDGIRCTLVGRTASKLTDALGTLPAEDLAPGQAHDMVVADVSLAADWDRAIGAFPWSGCTTILVNAAGIAQYSLLARQSAVEVKAILDTNLYATILGCKLATRQMIKEKTPGCIINISSLLGQKGGQGASTYAATKAGIIGFTRAIAAELGPKGIRTNVIVPGYIKTAMTEGMDQDRLAGLVPLRRLGEPEEVAEAALFLVNNQYANNCVLNLDGGLSAV